MPLVMVCGLPCSGKSRRVAELVDYIQSHHREREVQVYNYIYIHRVSSGYL